jgi:hypothetical protein
MVGCQGKKNTERKLEKCSWSIGATQLGDAHSRCDRIDVTDFSVSRVTSSSTSAWVRIFSRFNTGTRRNLVGARHREFLERHQLVRLPLLCHGCASLGAVTK